MHCPATLFSVLKEADDAGSADCGRPCTLSGISWGARNVAAVKSHQPPRCFPSVMGRQSHLWTEKKNIRKRRTLAWRCE